MLKKDNFWVGLMISLGLCILSIGIIIAVLFFLGLPLSNNATLLLFAFVPDIILLRYYAKKQKLKSLKGLSLILVFGFCLLVYYLNFIGSFNFSF